MIYQLNDTSPKYDQSTCFIAPSADLIGNIELGNEVSIWFQVVIRADNDAVRIGSRSNIQDHTTIHVDNGHPVIIGNNVTIGHKVTLHGCEIADNTLIGMGATVLNGAYIGKNSIVGAGALVTENKIFPDNSLIMGVPAKVVKILDCKQIEALKQSASHYCKKIREYKSLQVI